jgi:acetylornithine deacetylase
LHAGSGKPEATQMTQMDSGLAASAAGESAAPGRDALEMIDRLIAMPTVSRDSNLELIEFARDHLRALGASPRLIYDRHEKKANLFCSLAPDPAAVKNRGLILSGHTDTVPVDGQDWHSDPFRARHADGRIHGRGSADMKGFIAIALAWAPRFMRAPHLPIHLALTYDEETSFAGIRGLVADLAEQGMRPSGCMIGEPTDMQAVVAHKGKRDFCCRIRGKEAHSSLAPRGVNAIEAAARLIVHIRALAERVAREEPRDARFDIPHSTLQTGLIKGGIASNVVPRDCEFVFEMRNTPGASPDELTREIARYADEDLLPAMRQIADDAAIEMLIGMDLPAFGIDEKAPLVGWLQELARTAHLGAGAVGFATEASVFMSAGIPTVVMGPGSIEQAHRPNEYLSHAQVVACERFFERLIAARPPH